MALTLYEVCGNETVSVLLVKTGQSTHRTDLLVEELIHINHGYIGSSF